MSFFSSIPLDLSCALASLYASESARSRVDSLSEAQMACSIGLDALPQLKEGPDFLARAGFSTDKVRARVEKMSIRFIYETLR